MKDNEKFNMLQGEFYDIQNKLASLEMITEADTHKLMSIEIRKQIHEQIDRLMAVTKQLIELKS